jgi:hypothetical protein
MTELEFKKLLKDNFTRDQIIWFASNGSYDPDDTEGEIKADVARQLFDAKMDKTPDQTDKLLKFINGPKKTYDLQSFAQAAGFKDQKIGNKTLTAADQFYASYPNASRPDKELWNAGISIAFGEDGLDKLNRVMASEKRNREYAAQRKFDDRSLAGKIIDAVISPRETEARAEGRAPTDKDKRLDLAENVLMVMPFSGVAKAVGRAARIPSIASKILNRGAYAAATIGVPHAMEGLDSYFYSPEENLDRSKYRESDAVLGSLTNIVAPKALEMKFGRLNRYLPGSKGKPGMSEMGKAQLDQAIADGLWTKPKKETVKAVTEYNAAQMHGGEVDKVMPEFHEKLIQEMETGVPTNSMLDKSRASSIFKYMADHEPNNAAQNYIEAGFVQKAADDMGYEGAEQIAEGMAKSQNFDDIISFSDQVIKDANTMDMLRYRNPKLATAVDAALEAGANWGTNKYGSKRDADILLGGVSRMLGSIDPSLNLSKKLEDSRKEDIEEQRNEVKKSQAKQILDTQNLDAEDREWLNKLIKNPKMMEGYGEGGSSKFKNWLLLRGQDILRGTELFRPTYEVE